MNGTRIRPGTWPATRNKKRYWRCGEDSTHSWAAVVASRTGQGTGCPQCANLAVSGTNNLQHLAPGLAGSMT